MPTRHRFHEHSVDRNPSTDHESRAEIGDIYFWWCAATRSSATTVRGDTLRVAPFKGLGGTRLVRMERTPLQAIDGCIVRPRADRGIANRVSAADSDGSPMSLISIDLVACEFCYLRPGECSRQVFPGDMTVLVWRFRERFGWQVSVELSGRRSDPCSCFTKYTVCSSKLEAPSAGRATVVLHWNLRDPAKCSRSSLPFDRAQRVKAATPRYECIVAWRRVDRVRRMR